MANATSEPQILRPAAIGAALGFTVVTLAVTVAGVAMGIELPSAVGLGVFAGMWGGAGFGFMMGATLPLARHAAVVERILGDETGHVVGADEQQAA